MRVVLNNLTALGQKTGIGHYVTELLAHLRAHHAGRFSVFPGPCVAAGATAWGRIQRVIGCLTERHAGRSSASAGRDNSRACIGALARACAAWHFRASWSWRAFDVYHEPNYIPFPCARPTVATVHDLSLLLHSGWHPRHRVAHFERHFAPGLKRCAHLIADTEFTRRELIRHFHVAPDKVTCIHLGIRADLGVLPADAVRAARKRLSLPDDYLLHVGTLEPRKNLLSLMRAYGDLPRGLRERCPLLLAGGWGWNTAQLAQHIHGEGRDCGVRHLGYVADTDLAALYNGARALVFPSHYEGFGLPPLEMMACGGAVIASTAGAVVETVGRQAQLVDPLDLAGWRDAMHRVMVDDDWRHALRRGAKEVARAYTWQDCARRTHEVYCAVLRAREPLPQAA